MKALVVFHGHGCHLLAPLLRKGFAHVFVCVLTDGMWIMVDPRMGCPVIEPVGPEGFRQGGQWLFFTLFDKFRGGAMFDPELARWAIGLGLST